MTEEPKVATNAEESPMVGPLQIRILEIMWKENAPMTVHQVHRTLNSLTERQLAYTTVLTVMRNLANRAFLFQKPSGRSHIFEPRMSRDQFRQTLREYICRVYFNGDHASYVG